MFGKSQKLKKLITKYKLNPVDTFYIGDETRDIEAAKEAGVKSVAVTWGIESKSLLRMSNPDIIFEKVEDLLKLGCEL